MILRNLYYILNRPTPVRVKDQKHVTDLSIIRQSLLFQDRKATVITCKIAEIAQLNFIDYIACIGDLQLVIDRLPFQ